MVPCPCVVCTVHSIIKKPIISWSQSLFRSRALWMSQKSGYWSYDSLTCQHFTISHYSLMLQLYRSQVFSLFLQITHCRKQAFCRSKENFYSKELIHRGRNNAKDAMKNWKRQCQHCPCQVWMHPIAIALILFRRDGLLFLHGNPYYSWDV